MAKFIFKEPLSTHFHPTHNPSFFEKFCHVGEKLYFCIPNNRIMDTKKWVIACLALLLALPTEAQFYIWRESDNYLKNNGNPEFKYCYKLQTEDDFSPSTAYYEMTDTAHFDNRLVIENRSFFNDEDPWFLVFRISIDGKKDSVVLVDTTGIVEISFEKRPVTVTIKGGPVFDKFILPISQTALPKKMTLVWGRSKDSLEILTIHSKRELSHNELMEIRNRLCEGKKVYSDDYYYYLGDG